MKLPEIRDKIKYKIKGSFYSCSYYSERCKFVCFVIMHNYKVKNAFQFYVYVELLRFFSKSCTFRIDINYCRYVLWLLSRLGTDG